MNSDKNWSSQVKRYYVHGDRHEARPALYYCRACDLFQPAQHFYNGDHPINHHKLYQSDLRLWNRRKRFRALSAIGGGTYARGQHPHNLVNG